MSKTEKETEKEYIRITDLTKLRIIRNIMFDMQPVININDVEFTEVYYKIKKWINELEK